MDKKLEEQIKKIEIELDFLKTSHRTNAERCLKCINLLKDIKKKIKIREK